MVTAAPEPLRRRRHGEELESALLVSAWEELVEVGYGRLTMESVARRARTSEPVLYRRWPNKNQLVMASLEHYRKANPIAEPDTGSLRGDLLAHLQAVSEIFAGFLATAVAVSLSGLLVDADLTPRRSAKGSRRPSSFLGSESSFNGRTNAVRSTSTAFPARSLPCRSIWHDTTCSWSASR